MNAICGREKNEKGWEGTREERREKRRRERRFLEFLYSRNSLNLKQGLNFLVIFLYLLIIIFTFTFIAHLKGYIIECETLSQFTSLSEPAPRYFNFNSLFYF